MSFPGVTGTVSMVTGAAQGIGEAVARCLAAHGASVILVDANKERLDQVAKEISASGSRVLAAPADVRDAAAIESVVERGEKELGVIHSLVNVAGILRTGPILTYSDEDFETTLAVNVMGVFIVSRAVARRMAGRKSGSIVTVGSNAGGIPRMNMSAYAASKAASANFTKCLGLELAPLGIRCNVVSPGSTDTPMQRSLWTGDTVPDEILLGALDKFRLGIPLGKIAQPEDVANTVLFLLSDLANHITMQDIYIDGGASLGV